MMDNFQFPDDDISVLDDAHVESGASSGDPASSVPEFQIYSNHPRDVDEASHYALHLTCRTLQKRNKELEQQIVRLHKMYSRHQLASKLEPNNSPLPASITDRGGGKGNLACPPTGDSYTKFLEERVAALECENAKLVTKLKQEKSVVSELEELLSSLDLNMSGFTTGNGNLDLRFTEKYKELKARKDNSTTEYEQVIRPRMERERTEESKFDFTEQTSSEPLPCSGSARSKTPSKGDSFSGDLLQLIKQLNALKRTVLLQSNIIKGLIQKKAPSQLQGTSDGADKRDESAENPVVVFRSDFVYKRHLPNNGEPADSHENGASFRNYTAEAVIQLDNRGPVRLNNDTEHPSACRPDTEMSNTQAAVGHDVGDNRLYVAGLPQQTRTIEIERNINSPDVCSPRNHVQNVNLTEMTREKQIGLDDRQWVVMNNDPLIGMKHIPAHNISASKTCPLCEQSFPAEMKQADFECHVQTCLRRSVVDRAVPVNDEEAATGVRECPVCNIVLPPECCQSEFELHVNSHFDSEVDPVP